MFHSARIKLTAWYLLVIMVVSMSFSAVIYRALTIEVERFGRLQRYRIEHRMRDPIVIPFNENDPPPLIMPIEDTQLVNYIKHRMLVVLALVNGAIFVFSGLLGYLVAGRTLKPIQVMVEEQNRFISDASHEFRTPITAIKSMFEVNLRDKNLKLAAAREVIKEGIEEVNTLQSLSDSLLALAQYQKPHGTTQFETVDLDKVIGAAIKRVTPLAKEKNIHIHKHPVSGVSVYGVAHSLTDLFIILLDNAIKYNNPSGSISIDTHKTKSGVRVTVTDNGMGIPQKDLPHIFERFFRADSARTKNGGDGYGLGLAIAKQIIDAHRGTITATSTPHKGTTIHVTIPIKNISANIQI